MSSVLQHSKAVVLDHLAAIDGAPTPALADAIAAGVSDGYRWRGVHPFNELEGAEAVASSFWAPLREAFSPVQRRPDVFLAGGNTSGDGVWVCEMGHLLGLFDRPWLAIPPTNRMCLLRYAQFHRVEGDMIAESAMFTDVISVMRQAGQYPLPPASGSSHIQPGPRTHDGLLHEEQAATAGKETMALVDRMIDDLIEANHLGNETGENRVRREVLARTWHEDMIWSGPDGIGATYTIDRYQQQHQHPFRFNLSAKTFNGHVARFAEGNYACFFGWPNLTNTPGGGFLGMTGSDTPADMRVVDVYRRDGDRLAENWVFIDLLHWLGMQGLDVLARMRQLNGEAL